MHSWTMITVCNGLLRSPTCIRSLTGSKTISTILRGFRARAQSVVTGTAQVGASSHSTHPRVPFRAAVDFKFVIENVDEIKINVKNRLSDADPEKVVQLYAKFSELGRETDALRKERNDNAREMKVRDKYQNSIHLKTRILGGGLFIDL
jgi:hypothetical protein